MYNKYWTEYLTLLVNSKDKPWNVQMSNCQLINIRNKEIFNLLNKIYLESVVIQIGIYKNEQKMETNMAFKEVCDIISHQLSVSVCYDMYKKILFIIAEIFSKYFHEKPMNDMNLEYLHKTHEYNEQKKQWEIQPKIFNDLKRLHRELLVAHQSSTIEFENMVRSINEKNMNFDKNINLLSRNEKNISRILSFIQENLKKLIDHPIRENEITSKINNDVKMIHETYELFMVNIKKWIDTFDSAVNQLLSSTESNSE